MVRGLGILCALALAPAAAHAADALAARVTAAIGRGAEYLVSRQEPDGTWRSETYGLMRDGLSLTPHVATPLFFTSGECPASRAAFEKAVDYLVDPAATNGRASIYSIAGASWVVALGGRDARARWMDLLEERRLSRANGWSESDADFGGWGYAVETPRRARGESANLSATLFGIGALRVGGVAPDDPRWREILGFVMRCQNFADSPGQRDPAFDDGGFFFSPSDAARNKPGSAGLDRFGRERYFSYGSMTCDGLRALIRSGLPADHPRVAAALGWLGRHFDAAHNPGTFARDREALRDSYYFYYCWSFAHAMQALGLRTIETPSGRVEWAGEFAEELLRRQRPDGSWVNGFSDAKEDDPLVATPLALAALMICRAMGS